ncbi:aminotransferase class IV [Thalassospira sp. MA62]|nr:aminotransferase class IV [Thalassospira sp. MA62]
MQIWLNGNYLPADNAMVPVTDRGYLLGDGIFETMRAHRGQVALLRSHLDRLSRHGVRIGFPVSTIPSPDTVAAVIETLCRDLESTDAVVRLTMSRGAGTRGLQPTGKEKPTILVTVNSFQPVDPDQYLSLITAQQVRRNPWSVSGTIKSTNYLDNIVAKTEAANAGADDAIVLSTDGHVAETTIANLFAIKGNTIWTPDGNLGIFTGIGRSLVLDIAADAGLVINHDRKSSDMLRSCDAVFATNALQGARRVHHIDGHELDMAENDRFLNIADKLGKMLCGLSQ